MNQSPRLGHTPGPAPPMSATHVEQTMVPSAGIAYQITHGPSFALLRVDLQPGQVLIAEAGSMVARHAHVAMEVKLNAGRSAGLLGTLWAFLVALVRKLVGGETLFVGHFRAAQPGSVWVAPTMSGSIMHRRVHPGERIVLSRGAYLASAGNVDVRVRFGGLKSILAKEGAFLIEISGSGDLWFTSYGGIQAIDIDGSYMVDNGHLVGYEGQLTMTIRSAGGGLLGFLVSGEGLVCEFRGRGRVYVQSRSVGSLVDWLAPIVPS